MVVPPINRRRAGSRRRSENVFRAGPKGVDDAVAAIKKIQRNAEELNAAAEELKRKYGR